MTIKNYDPKKLVFVWGEIIASGYADGVFVSAKRNGDSFGIHVGADGITTRVLMADRSGEVTLNLAQSSQVNDLLSARMALDELTGLGTAPLLVKDIVGTTLITAQSAWLKKPADAEFGKEVSEREWIFVCDELLMLVGGSLL